MSDNNTLNDPEEPSSVAYHILWQSIYTLLVIFLNSVVLYVFVFKIKERTLSNTCFISLAICDLVVGFVVFPATIYYDNLNCDLNFYLGVFVLIVGYAQPSIGLLTLFLLTWHRILQLTRPAQSTEKLTLTRILLIVGVWAAQYLAWLTIFIACILTNNYDIPDLDIVPPAIYVLLIDIIFYIIPVLVDVVLISITIVIIIKRYLKKKKTSLRKVVITTTTSSNSIGQSSKKGPTFCSCKVSRDSKAVIFLVTLILVILFSQSLFFITWPLTSFGYHQNDDTLVEISDWLSYSNSFFNPIVMFIFHERLNTSVRDLLNCRRLL